MGLVLARTPSFPAHPVRETAGSSDTGPAAFAGPVGSAHHGRVYSVAGSANTVMRVFPLTVIVGVPAPPAVEAHRLT